jgi:flavin-binding protein dodecin
MQTRRHKSFLGLANRHFACRVDRPSLDKGWEEAAQEAVIEAAKSVKHIRSVWIKDHAATIGGGKVKRYRVTCKITFES